MQSVQNNWYVQVEGQSYGPYSAEQMKAYVIEGRVAPQSFISPSEMQSFAPAHQFPEYLSWSQKEAVPLKAAAPQNILRPMSNVGGGVLARQMQPATYAPQNIAPNPSLNTQSQIAPQMVYQQDAQAAPNAQAKTVFIVMAEIRSDNGLQFLQALQQEGTAQRIGDSVWLLRSQTSVEQLRNRLSNTLTKDDRLFLLDSFANKTAWFNIGSDMDVRIRELWDLEN